MLGHYDSGGKEAAAVVEISLPISMPGFKKVPLIAGERYSIAAITALVPVDSAAKAINLPAPEQFAAFKRWVKNILSSSRL